MFSCAIQGPVKYEAVSQDIMLGNAIPPSPLRKAPRFAAQQEERIVFFPKPSGLKLSDRILIRIPNAYEHFEEVFRGFKR